MTGSSRDGVSNKRGSAGGPSAHPPLLAPDLHCKGSQVGPLLRQDLTDTEEALIPHLVT